MHLSTLVENRLRIGLIEVDLVSFVPILRLASVYL